MAENEGTPQPRQRRCVVVTGASSGIGRSAAQAFARMGWHVIGTGRDEARCNDAAERITAGASRDARIDMLRGDFSEMQEVRRIAREIAGLTDHVNVLINNAGGVRDGEYRTSDGLEATFAANHLSAFLLTRELMPLLERAAGDNPPGLTRVIAVSSAGHAACTGMRWYDLGMKAAFDANAAYCQAKLANLLFARELDRKVRDKGIVSLTMHPGRVDSNFASHADPQMQAWMRSNDTVPPEQPARTLVWLATALELGGMGGRYFHDLKEEEAAPQARDDSAAARLWTESEKMLQGILTSAS